jgi:hypothetical protein
MRFVNDKNSFNAQVVLEWDSAMKIEHAEDYRKRMGRPALTKSEIVTIKRMNEDYNRSENSPVGENDSS